MRRTTKLFDLRRLDYQTAAKVLKTLIKKKVGLQLSTNEVIDLEFFDCLRLVDGFIIKSDYSTMRISVSTKHSHRTISLRKGILSSDLTVFKQILVWTEYKPVVDAFRLYFHQDSQLNIIDAGGNIGLTSIYFAAYFKDSKIVSIEPNPDNFSLLVANVGQLNVTCIRGAIWSRSGDLKLVNDFRDKLSWSCRVVQNGAKDAITVTAYTISELKESNGFDYIDILKMDIEGAEKEIFSQLDPDFLSYTKCIVIEIHDEFDCRNAIYECLELNNFLYFNQGELTIGVNKKLINTNFSPKNIDRNN